MAALERLIARARQQAPASIALQQLFAAVDARRYWRHDAYQAWCQSLQAELPRGWWGWLCTLLSGKAAPI